jgi:hypothetical protein
VPLCRITSTSCHSKQTVDQSQRIFCAILSLRNRTRFYSSFIARYYRAISSGDKNRAIFHVTRAILSRDKYRALKSRDFYRSSDIGLYPHPPDEKHAAALWIISGTALTLTDYYGPKLHPLKVKKEVFPVR